MDSQPRHIPAQRRRGSPLPVADRRAWKAVGFGIASFIPGAGGVFGLMGLVLGVLALAGRTRCRIMATVGICLCAAGIWAHIFLGFIVPALGWQWRTKISIRAVCASNLHAIGTEVHIYLAEYDEMPPDLDTLVAEGHMAANDLKCPSAEGGRACDYFCLDVGRPDGVPDPAVAIMACDFKGNHKDGRNVLYVDGHIVWLTEAEFQAELAKPENAAFAKALRKAEGP